MMTDNPLAPALDAIAARLKADAERIAELEAELERLDSFDVGLDAALAKLEAENRLLNEARENANAATFRVEAELAALKGRRCETCRKFGICEVNRVLWSEFHEVEIGCTRWAERRAG
jgi:exonuclease VII small subunit